MAGRTGAEKTRGRAWPRVAEPPLGWALALGCALALAAAACGNGAEREGEVSAGSASPRPDAAPSQLPGAGTTTTAPAEEAAGLPKSAGPKRPTVLFLGTSLTAGYGLPSPDSAYPGLLGRRWADAGYGYEAVNAGVSGDTSAGGRARLAGLLETYAASLAVLVVELGANDGLRGRDPEALYENLAWIVSETRRRRPSADVVVVSMEAPPNMGEDYAARFREVFGRAARDGGALLAPFLLEGVAGVPELNQDDRIHPNAAGHAALADNLWPVLQQRLGDRCRQDGAC